MSTGFQLNVSGTARPVIVQIVSGLILFHGEFFCNLGSSIFVWMHSFDCINVVHIIVI
jgi:hypothetical protein